MTDDELIARLEQINSPEARERINQLQFLKALTAVKRISRPRRGNPGVPGARYIEKEDSHE